ncbi:MAG: hypothetical protein DDT23_00121 [candidate division WS2 bacterium]|nr:hypothetical protein [Candidatus Lithacetigena glycinireducens]
MIEKMNNYLANLKIGQKGIIMEIKGGKGLLQRLYSLGIIPGLPFQVENTSFGPVVIKVSSAKVALGRGVASKIMVKTISEQMP